MAPRRPGGTPRVAVHRGEPHGGHHHGAAGELVEVGHRQGRVGEHRRVARHEGQRVAGAEAHRCLSRGSLRARRRAPAQWWPAPPGPPYRRCRPHAPAGGVLDEHLGQGVHHVRADAVAVRCELVEADDPASRGPVRPNVARPSWWRASAAAAAPGVRRDDGLVAIGADTRRPPVDPPVRGDLLRVRVGGHDAFARRGSTPGLTLTADGDDVVEGQVGAVEDAHTKSLHLGRRGATRLSVAGASAEAAKSCSRADNERGP